MATITNISAMDISPPQPEQHTNWLELPRDVTLTILSKLTPIEILESAQFVCKSWYSICKDPSMWRTIRLDNLDERELAGRHEGVMCNAVDRSAGGLVDVDVEGFGSDHLLSYIANRSIQLKCLRLACCYSISADALIKAFEKLPSLEELELTLCPFTAEKTLYVIHACPCLKIFKLNEQCSRNPSFACDDEALAIAESMPELRHLQLIGNSMTNDGLKAILDSCPHLQSLDLRACFHLDLNGNLGKRCAAQIKNLRRPNDSTEDYNYLTTDYDSEFDEIYAGEIEFDYMEYMSDDEVYQFSDDNEIYDFD